MQSILRPTLNSPLNAINSRGGGGGSPPSASSLDIWQSSSFGVYTNGAAHFSAASSQYLSNASFSALSAVTAFSIFVCLKRDDASDSVSVSQVDDTANRMNISLWSDGILYFGLSNAELTYGTYSLPGTGWHPVVMVFDGSLTGNANRLKAYVDSAAVTLAYAGTIPAVTPTFTNAFEVGRIARIPGTTYSQGSGDSLAVWARALSSSEALWLCNSGAGRAMEEIQAHPTLSDAEDGYNLDEASGTRYDYFGSKDLTASNTVIIGGATRNGNFETRGTGGTIDNVPTSTVARAANVATIVAGISHGLTTGNIITMTGLTDTTFNAVGVTVTVINATTFTYPNTGSNVGAGADTGGRIQTEIFANWGSNTSAAGLLSLETSIVHDGTAAAKCVSGPVGADNVGIYQTCLVVGDLYELVMWSRTDAGTGGITATMGLGSGTIIFQPSINAVYTQYASSAFTADDTSFNVRRTFVGETFFLDTFTLTDKGPVGVAGIAAGLASNSQSTSRWLDQTSNHYNLLQATEALRPIYYTNIQNGKPGVFFNGASNIVEVSGISLPVGTEPRTVFLVLKQTIVQNSFPVIWDAPTNHCGININGTFKVYLENYYDSGIAIANNTAYVVAFVYDGTTLATYVNGVAGAAFTPTTPIVSGAANLALGALHGGALAFGGYIFNNDVHDFAMNPLQLSQEFRFHMNAWGI